ncbi:MAG: PAS domain S-box protein, partial [Chloroflexota bacterium]
MASLLDITESRRTENQLRESEKNYQSLFKNIPSGIYRSTSDGEILAANPALVRMLGYESEDELKKVHILDLYADPENREDLLKSISKNGETFNKEICLKRKDGQIIAALDSTRAIHDEHGKVLCFEGTLTDITERTLANKKLQENEEKLRNIVEYSTNMFYSHTPDHILTYVSPQSKQLLDYEPEEMLIKWLDLTTDDPINQQGFMITQAAINTGMPQPPYELELISKNKRRVWVEVREAPVVRDGKTIAIVGALTDITERKRAQQEIEALLDVSRQAGSMTSLDELLFSIAARIVEVITPAEAASIHLYDEERQVLKVQAWAGFEDSEIKGIEFKVKDSLGGGILRTRKPALINDVSGDPDYKLVDKPGIKIIKSQIAVRLIYKERVIGIIFADNRTRTGAFLQKDLDFLESIGNQLAGTIENTRLLDQVREDQKRLSQSEEQYRSVVEDSPLLICRFLPDGTITFVNQEYRKYFGNKNDELIGRNIQVTVLEEDREKVLSDIALLSAESPILISENKNLKRNGEFCWIRWTSRALFDDKERITSYQAFGDDISERKRTEQLLNALNQAGIAMGKALTHTEIFNAIADQLKQLDISCMLFPLDESKTRLYTRYLDYESAQLIKAEKLAGLEHKDLSF